MHSAKVTVAQKFQFFTSPDIPLWYSQGNEISDRIDLQKSAPARDMLVLGPFEYIKHFLAATIRLQPYFLFF